MEKSSRSRPRPLGPSLASDSAVTKPDPTTDTLLEPEELPVVVVLDVKMAVPSCLTAEEDAAATTDDSSDDVEAVVVVVVVVMEELSPLTADEDEDATTDDSSEDDEARFSLLSALLLFFLLPLLSMQLLLPFPIVLLAPNEDGAETSDTASSIFCISSCERNCSNLVGPFLGFLGGGISRFQ